MRVRTLGRMELLRSAMIGFIVGCVTIQAAAAADTAPAPAALHTPADFWATVPRGICIWKNTPLNEQEIAAIAKYRLVQTMIPDGIPWRGGTGNVALEIKKHRPDAVVIGYKNIVVHYDYHGDPAIFRNYPDWFIYDRQGVAVMHNNRRPIHDLRKPAMREWWVANVQRLLKTPGFDGILIDAVTKVYDYAPILQALSPGERDAYVAGFHDMMRSTREQCGGEGLLIGNCLRAVHDDAGMAILRKYFDGSYLELFDTPMKPEGRPPLSYEDWVARGIDAVQRASAEGRLIFLTMSPETEKQNDVADVRADAQPRGAVDDETLQRDHTYKLAMFLICAGERSYWGYQFSRNAATDPGQWDPDFPEYRRPLGPPRGPASRNGFAYTREFQHASVKLDLVKREGQIHWRTPTGP